jgi:GDP-mannose 6-dehydrogenase
VALAEILIGKGLDVQIHDPFVNTATLTGANLRYVEQRLPHLHKVLHDDAEAALLGAHVAVVSSAGADVLRRLVGSAPPVVIDLDGRLGQDVEALAGYQGVGW